MTRHDALHEMGYRQTSTRTWSKPVGYQLLVYDDVSGNLCNYFMSEKGNVMMWEDTRLDDDSDLVGQIMDFECRTRLDICTAFVPYWKEMKVIKMI